MPTPGPGRGRPKPTSKTTPSRWPGRLLEGKGKGPRGGKYTGRAFRVRGRDDDMLVYRRVGKGRTRKLRLMYVLTKSVEVPDRWDFDGIAERVMASGWAKNQKKALDHALKTARRGNRDGTAKMVRQLSRIF